MRNLVTSSVLLSVVLALTGCGGITHMVKKETGPTAASVQPTPGKAALVVARTTGFGGGAEFRTYLDKKVIGHTRGYTYFTKTDVEPGPHYVISWGENGVAVKVPFEAGKTYYLLQNVTVGAWNARVVMAAADAKFLDSGELASCNYYEFKPEQAPEDLSEEDYKDVIQGAESLNLKPDGTAELVAPK